MCNWSIPFSHIAGMSQKNLEILKNECKFAFYWVMDEDDQSAG